MGKDTYRVRVTNRPPSAFWTAGYLFTLGYLVIGLEITSIWEVMGIVLITYFIWPLLLGMSLAVGG